MASRTRRQPVPKPGACAGRAFLLRCAPALLCLSLWAGYRGGTLAGRGAVPARIYTLTALRTQLQREPLAWLNKTVHVRALLTSCRDVAPVAGSSPCQDRQVALLDPQATHRTWKLPVLLGSAPPMLTVLRQVPLLGDLVPAPQVLRWGTAAVYAVQLRRAPCSQPGGPACFAALLLDAGPWEGSAQHRGAGRNGLVASP
jgi:hypothetical protein